MFRTLTTESLLPRPLRLALLALLAFGAVLAASPADAQAQTVSV